MLDEILKWQKRFDRERKARKQAEQLLEEKSRELYEQNKKLKKAQQYSKACILDMGYR